ncbi:MAG: hypothetical protein HY861_01135 [Chlamydiia bacterium]|nr:hypothetical protein [Chlamydiia bacterium]
MEGISFFRRTYFLQLPKPVLAAAFTALIVWRSTNVFQDALPALQQTGRGFRSVLVLSGAATALAFLVTRYACRRLTSPGMRNERRGEQGSEATPQRVVGELAAALPPAEQLQHAVILPSVDVEILQSPIDRNWPARIKQWMQKKTQDNYCAEQSFAEVSEIVSGLFDEKKTSDAMYYGALYEAELRISRSSYSLFFHLVNKFCTDSDYVSADALLQQAKDWQIAEIDAGEMVFEILFDQRCKIREERRAAEDPMHPLAPPPAFLFLKSFSKWPQLLEKMERSIEMQRVDGAAVCCSLIRSYFEESSVWAKSAFDNSLQRENLYTAYACLLLFPWRDANEESCVRQLWNAALKKVQLDISFRLACTQNQLFSDADYVNFLDSAFAFQDQVYDFESFFLIKMLKNAEVQLANLQKWCQRLIDLKDFFNMEMFLMPIFSTLKRTDLADQWLRRIVEGSVQAPLIYSTSLRAAGAVSNPELRRQLLQQVIENAQKKRNIQMMRLAVSNLPEEIKQEVAQLLGDCVV